MRNSKGISMISLIVTVLCTILLASLAIGTGTRYIRESRSKDRAAFISVMSNAVVRRHADTALNSIAYPYLGYRINDSVKFETIFVPKVSEPIKYENGIWYVLDTTTARELGVQEPERYVATIDLNYEEMVKVALVDYATGKVYLIDVNADEMGTFDSITSGPVSGHEHRYLSEATCTEAKKCEDCGFIDEEAKGHQYGEENRPEPASGDEENSHFNRKCIICNMQGGYEPHNFEFEHFIKDEEWYHKSKCTVCEYEKKFGLEVEERCTEELRTIETEPDRSVYHIHFCRICEHTVEKERHNIQYRSIGVDMHEKYCADDCGYKGVEEFHVDESVVDEKCDLCGADIIVTSYPKIGIVEMENANPISPEQKYIARYGDNIRLRVVSNKPLNKDSMEVYIAGRRVAAENIMISENKKELNITFYLNPNVSTPDGVIQFSINGESVDGYEFPDGAITTTSNKTYVIFDGTSPEIEYIDKVDRINEK